jgi:diaminopimelate decarboxylase
MLYQAYHVIENLSREQEAGSKKQEAGDSNSSQISNLKSQILHYDVVGPICESTDCFRKDVELPESFRGDLIAIRTAGAYAEVMSSGYNLRDKAASVYSD